MDSGLSDPTTSVVGNLTREMIDLTGESESGVGEEGEREGGIGVGS